jgi:hypothetical protein
MQEVLNLHSLEIEELRKKRMEYLTIFRPYKLRELTVKAKSEKEGGNFDEAEAKNWDDALNKYAQHGYRVIKCGTIVFGDDVIFWAILEKS